MDRLTPFGLLAMSVAVTMLPMSACRGESIDFGGPSAAIEALSRVDGIVGCAEEKRPIQVTGVTADVICDWKGENPDAPFGSLGFGTRLLVFVTFFENEEDAGRFAARTCGSGQTGFGQTGFSPPSVFYSPGNKWVLNTGWELSPAPDSLVEDIEEVTGIEAGSGC